MQITDTTQASNFVTEVINLELSICLHVLLKTLHTADTAVKLVMLEWSSFYLNSYLTILLWPFINYLPS